MQGPRLEETEENINQVLLFLFSFLSEMKNWSCIISNKEKQQVGSRVSGTILNKTRMSHKAEAKKELETCSRRK